MRHYHLSMNLDALLRAMREHDLDLQSITLSDDGRTRRVVIKVRRFPAWARGPSN